MTPEAMAYLNEALDYIQANAIRRDRVNWPGLRQEVYDLVHDAKIPADTYPGIELALEHLNDNHSFFSSPEKEQRRLAGVTKRIGLRSTYPEGNVVVVYSGSPAEQAGIQVGDCIIELNGHPLSTLTRQQFQLMMSKEQVDLVLQPKGEKALRSVCLQASFHDARRMPEGRRLTSNIGYLDLPELIGSTEHNRFYMVEVQRLIREIDEHSICGWVIDLRRNFGGNMWPMIIGVGSLLGEGEWLAFTSPWKNVIGFYRDGKAGTDAQGVLAEIEDPYQLKRAYSSVAVLTSQMTVSSGEFMALAFRGRPHTCSFGEATYGLPTSNFSKVLSDGALLALTTRLGVDRTGRTFDGPIPPNHYVKVDWASLGTEVDPVLQTALEWLQTEENCLEHHLY